METCILGSMVIAVPDPEAPYRPFPLYCVLSNPAYKYSLSLFFFLFLYLSLPFFTSLPRSLPFFPLYFFSPSPSVFLYFALYLQSFTFFSLFLFPLPPLSPLFLSGLWCWPCSLIDAAECDELPVYVPPSILSCFLFSPPFSVFPTIPMHLFFDTIVFTWWFD